MTNKWLKSHSKWRLRDLLYITRDSAQCYVAAWIEGEFGGEWIHVYIWLSRYCAPETITLSISCTPIQNERLKEKIKGLSCWGNWVFYIGSHSGWWQDFPGGWVVKNPPANAGDSRNMGSIPGLGRSPGAGNGNSLQCSCLENPMDRGAWQAAVCRVAKSQTEWLSMHAHRMMAGLEDISEPGPEFLNGGTCSGGWNMISLWSGRGCE